MVEIIIVVATLTIVIFTWAHINKALNWAGTQVGQTTDMLTDITKAGGVQTSRTVVVSQKSFLDTVHDAREAAIKREEATKKMVSKLDTEQKKSLETYDKELKDLLKRD